jgi:hypothetical protein
MSTLSGGPGIVTDGLVLSLDAANVKSLADVPATNRLTWSEQFENWSSFNPSTIISNYALSPINTLSADLHINLFGNAGGRQTSINITGTPIGSKYTISIYCKKSPNNSSATSLFLAYRFSGGANSLIETARIFQVSDDWVRYSVTASVDYSDRTSLIIIFGNYNISSPPASNSELLLWGAQLETGTTPTTYIPTTTTAVSRVPNWKDISRGGNNGTLVNGPTYNPANGGSLVFDGVNDYADCGNPTNTLISDNIISVFVWFYCTRTTNEPVAFRTNDYTTGWNMWVSNGVLRSTLRPSVSNNNNIYSGTISANNWYQGGFTCDGITIRQYLNGLQVGSTPVATTLNLNNGDTLKIGGHNIYSVQTTMQGRIPKVEIYNRTLSPTEILQNFNATKTRFGL